MLVAYLDEFGHVGPYISTSHKKFFHNPIFGYAGIVLPEQSIRPFGAKFEHVKARTFRNEIIPTQKHPRRWEKKGAEIFTTGAYNRNPGRVDIIDDLADYLHRLEGKIVFYGQRKPFGSTKETGQTPSDLTRIALTEVVRRLCRYADARNQSLMVLLDRGGPMPREDAITSMATFIYSAEERSMKRIIEVPVELESHRYGAMQFADWMCGIAGRASHYHFSDSDEFDWSPSVLKQIFGNRVMQGSRVWLPENRKPVTINALEKTQKWVNWYAALEAAKTRPHLTQSIAEAIRT